MLFFITILLLQRASAARGECSLDEPWKTPLDNGTTSLPVAESSVAHDDWGDRLEFCKIMTSDRLSFAFVCFGVHAHLGQDGM